MDLIKLSDGKLSDGFVIWLTGFSGSGKSTISVELHQYFQQLGRKCEHLDGDNIRDIFPSTGFSKEARNDHIRRIGFIASLLEKHGVIVIASFVSPYADSRNFARNLCKNFIEIHVSTPLEICEQRDVKGLYRKARTGEIQLFTGISDPYEVPENPEITIDTSKLSLEEACLKTINEIKSIIEGI